MREATWFLILLAATVVGLTAFEAAQGGIPLGMYAPAAVMLGLLAAWPFLNGWRPFTPAGQQLRDCSSCGVQWRPADEEGTMRCPACTETA